MMKFTYSIDHYNFGGSHASDIITCLNGSLRGQSCIIMRVNAHLFCQINILLLQLGLSTGIV